MQIEFAHPWTLLFLPVVIGIAVGISIWDRAKYGGKWKSRSLGELAVRCLVLSLVVFAIAGVSVRKSSDMTTTIYLVDLSDSVRDSVEEEISFLRSAIGLLPEKNQAGIVVFGADAQIEQFVTDKKVFSDVQSEVTASATNLEQAVQTAQALFPDDTAKRLVLLTDGEENEGNLADLAVSFQGAGTELKVVRYDNTVVDEVYVSDVKLPETISEGDKFEVQVEVYASEPTAATVSLYSGRSLKGQKNVNLQKGENALVFSDQGVESGIKSYRVTVEAEKDTVSVNNMYSAFTTVETPSKILVVEGAKKESEEFVKILRACNYDYEVVTPSGVPAKVTDMLQYQSVVLLDVYADDLRSGFLDMLETYVKDYAGGLVTIGGPNSYALGHYRNTPLEEVLPVKMELEGEKQIPKLAMAMVIDHSGSMSSPASSTSNMSCMEVAKQAAVNALDSLREIDEVGVLAFDDTYTWSVPLEEATDIAGITERIVGISSRGGTSIYPAVNEAVQELKKSDAALKHIVLLTDGMDGYHAYDPLIEDIKENEITLSTVAVGEGADAGMLQWLAENGGGRYYYSDAGTALPRIFAQEVYLSAKSYLINEEFSPVLANSHEIVQGIFDQGVPSLLGYVATTPKPASTVLLKSTRDDPVLAVWQYGLGRTVAWTSDGTNNWTGNWAGWDGYAALWHNIIDWTVSDTGLGEDSLTVGQESGHAVITYETQDYTNRTEVSAIVTDEEGRQQEVNLKASSPGTFQAQVPLTEAGVYSVNLRNRQGEEMVKNINTAAAIQYSQEYRYAEVTNNLDQFVKQVNGRYIEKPQDVYDSDLRGAMARTPLTTGLLVAAVFLFLLDILFRRLSIDWASGAVRAANRVWQAAVSFVQKKKSHAGMVPPQKMSEGTASGYAASQQASGSLSSSQQKMSAGSAVSSPQEAEGTASGYAVPPQKAKKLEKEARREAQRMQKQQRRSEKHTQEESSVIDTGMLLKKKEDRDL